MNTSVTVRPMAFDATVPNVFVTACCTPTTSLLRRDINAPVCVHVKKESGNRWTWSNSATRMS